MIDATPLPQHTAKSVEWYTPADVIARACRVFGTGIDLDPASCAAANETVGARRIFTVDDDGLSQPWAAKHVWCNPPYGRVGPRFVAHALAELRARRYKCGLLLVKAAVETRWFRPLWDFPVCFPYRRIQFNTADGATRGAPHASAIVLLRGDWLGWSYDKPFERAFGGDFGHVCWPAGPDS